MAVDLAKMSLWLVTLAKDHAMTFVDHALRHDDSVVGLSRRQLDGYALRTLLPGIGKFTSQFSVETPVGPNRNRVFLAIS